MISRKIGSRFLYNGVSVEVVASDNCKDCFFYEMCTRTDRTRPDEAGYCSATRRRDGKSVKYLPVAALTLIKEQIDNLLHEANQMEEDYAGRKEEEFYSGMIHGLALLNEFIKRKFQSS